MVDSDSLGAVKVIFTRYSLLIRLFEGDEPPGWVEKKTIGADTF